MKYLLSAFVAVNLSMVSGASAAGGEFKGCSCVSAPLSTSATIGRITSAKGEVLYTGARGYESGKSGSPLTRGAQISVGDNGSARISVGSSCTLNIAANSIVNIQQPIGNSGNICVRVSSLNNSSSELVQTGSSTQAGSGVSLPLIVVGGAVIVGAVIVVSGGSSSASP